MKKTNYFLMATTMFVLLFVAACGSAAPATQQVAPPTAAPTQAPVIIEQPTDSAPPTAQTFAPACPAVASCAAPAVADIEAINTYCVQKIPYQNISLPANTSFEVLDTKGEFKCADSGTVVKGEKIISCTGKQLITYELKLTNTACGASNLAVGTGQCPDGSGFDSAQNCCAPVSESNASTTIKVNIGGCP